MAYQRSMSQGDTMRLFYSPDRPQTGDVLTMNANVMSVGGEPLRTANVVVQVKSPSQKVQSIRLQAGARISGVCLREPFPRQNRANTRSR